MALVVRAEMSGGQSLFSMPVDLTNLAKQIFSGGKSSSPTDDLAALDKSSDTDSNSELHTDGANTGRLRSLDIDAGGPSVSPMFLYLNLFCKMEMV